MRLLGSPGARDMGLASFSLALAMASGGMAPVHYSFDVARAQGTIFNPWTLSDDKVELRSFVGSGARPGDFVAPTIRVAPGQQLRIDLANRLEPCSDKQRTDHSCFNDTNIHTHGLWVSPSGNSDNVLISVPPGSVHHYVYDVSADHPAGTFWYHPHSHGAGYAQVGSGMAGALIITGSRLPDGTRPGDIDVLLKDERGRALAERIMIFQQIEYGCVDDKGVIEGERDKAGDPVRPFTCSPGQTGRIESFDYDWGWRHDGRFTGINGKVQPTLGAAKAGAFERWRLINAGVGEAMRMRLYRLDPAAPPLRTVKAADQVAWRTRYCTGAALPMWQIALDGLTRSSAMKVDQAVLFPGERMDLLARLPKPGQYCLVNDTSRDDPKGLNPSRMIAIVGANGPSGPDLDGEALLRSMLVRAAERALPAKDQLAIRARVVGELDDGLKLTSFTWHKTIAEAEVSGYREAILNVVETPTDAFFRINGQDYDHHRIDAVLPLGKAEEWRLASLNEDHPLHIHVNPFQLVSIVDEQGRDVTDPKGPAFDADYLGLKGQWKDTILIKQGLRIAFRTRYERFTGDFVLHCHIMYHGDHGMMQNLRIAGEADAAPAAHVMH